MTNERKILFLCGTGHFYSHFYMLMFPSLALWIHKDFGMSLPDTLNLGFGMYLLLGLAALPMGALGDRTSAHKMLVLMHIGAGLSALVCAASSGPGMLMVGLAAIGFFASIYHPVGIGLISKCCRNRGRALGNNGVFGNLGVGAAPFLAGATAYLVGWRFSFGFFGVLMFLVGVAMMRARIDERPLDPEDAGNNGQASGASNVVFFVLMLCCMMLLGFVYRGTIVSLPAYFQDNIRVFQALFNLQPGVQVSGSQSFGATLLVSGVYLFGIFGQMTGGRLADKVDLRMAYLAFHTISLPFMFLMAKLTGLPLFAASMVYLFFALGMQPIENSLVARLTPNRLRSLAYGLKFVLVLGIGSFSVKLVKWIMTHQDPAMVYMVQSGMILGAIALIVLIYVLSRRQSFRNT